MVMRGMAAPFSDRMVGHKRRKSGAEFYSTGSMMRKPSPLLSTPMPVEKNVINIKCDRMPTKSLQIKVVTPTSLESIAEEYDENVEPGTGRFVSVYMRFPIHRVKVAWCWKSHVPLVNESAMELSRAHRVSMPTVRVVKVQKQCSLSSRQSNIFGIRVLNSWQIK